MVVPCVSLASTPSEASRSQTARPSSDANVTPAHSPRPLTDVTADDGSDPSRACSTDPRAADRAGTRRCAASR